MIDRVGWGAVLAPPLRRFRFVWPAHWNARRGVGCVGVAWPFPFFGHRGSACIALRKCLYLTDDIGGLDRKAGRVFDDGDFASICLWLGAPLYISLLYLRTRCCWFFVRL